MAARALGPGAKAFQRGLAEILIKATGASTSDVTKTYSLGVATIARTNTGTHTITLSDKWKALVGFSACIEDATTPDDWEVQVVSEDVASAKTINIAIFKGGTAADITTDEKIYINLKLLNSSQLPTNG